MASSSSLGIQYSDLSPGSSLRPLPSSCRKNGREAIRFSISTENSIR
uniref:Uncharacterized protein n=1 Tax=Utricularia reniformis TaxID=192314 RepID=A0A1Y0B2P1_9LAMI|nr:hypothetical protein AEK19_MT1526 [Utricularia reniformis]ART31715.1 hypothetical protein AEK19_MT1526 [Utricularia reniformis]